MGVTSAVLLRTRDELAATLEADPPPDFGVPVAMKILDLMA